MPSYDLRVELSPHDVVTRSIDDQLKKHDEMCVLLDVSHRPRDVVRFHFPNIMSECLKHRLGTRHPIPVIPVAHYMCGDVRVGLHSETNVSDLFVVGEAACTGFHGVNRLASNSLLEALVFAQRAVEPSIDMSRSTSGKAEVESWPRLDVPWTLGYDVVVEIERYTKEARKELQSIMWEYVGIVRSTRRLKTAESRLRDLEGEWEEFLVRRGWRRRMVGVEACEMRNLFCLAKLVVRSALARRESRGLHYTKDFPYLEESKRKPTVTNPKF